MKISRSILLGGLISSSALFICGFLLTSAPQQARASVLQEQQPEKKYKLYCVNGKVEIGTRTLEDIKWARGEDVCMLASFDNLSEAEEAANHYGGIGADCSCQ